MKKIYTLSLLVLSMIFTQTISAQTTPQVCSILTRSITKTTVITAQERQILSNLFKKEGIVLGSKNTDIYKAIGLFQKKYRLEVVGTVGPKTLLKINEIVRSSCSQTTVPSVVVSTSSVVQPATSTTSVTSQTTVVSMDPPQIDLLNPNGDESIEQGFGRTYNIVWTSKHIPTTADVTIEILGENLESVIKSWKVKNTGKHTLTVDEVDDLSTGWFYARMRYMCNSQTIACAEDTSNTMFVVYPPSGWVANFFHFNAFKSGEKYSINDSQSMVVSWYTYSKDFDYYKVYLGNVVLGKEVLSGNTQSYSHAIKAYDVRELKKDVTKSNTEIENAYYVKVQVAKRNVSGGPDKIIKEIVSGQFGIR